VPIAAAPVFIEPEIIEEIVQEQISVEQPVSETLQMECHHMDQTVFIEEAVDPVG